MDMPSGYGGGGGAEIFTVLVWRKKFTTMLSVYRRGANLTIRRNGNLTKRNY